jgi:hypothetical protein
MPEKPQSEHSLDSRLDEALELTFPAGDPIAVHSPDSPLRIVSGFAASRASCQNVGNLQAQRGLAKPKSATLSPRQASRLTLTQSSAPKSKARRHARSTLMMLNVYHASPTRITPALESSG